MGNKAFIYRILILEFAYHYQAIVSIVLSHICARFNDARTNIQLLVTTVNHYIYIVKSSERFRAVTVMTRM